MKTLKRPSTLQIAMHMIRLHLMGWRQVTGYTIAEGDARKGFYFAVELVPPLNALPHQLGEK